MKMNIPNRLTLIRILLVPIVVAIYLCMDETIGIVDAQSGLALRDILAFIIFAVASITDFFDGMLARKYNWITSFGKFADPIADKLLVNTVLILMVYEHNASVVAVLLMIARDLVVDGLRMSAASSGEVVSAGIFGKLKTVLQMFALIFLLLRNWPFVYMGIPMDQILLWLATIASLYSGWIYFNQLKKYVMETM
jgi:CDP-diacylglycerol---glycerol-3-phosphate 3-phosphatidyltransferase